MQGDAVWGVLEAGMASQCGDAQAEPQAQRQQDESHNPTGIAARATEAAAVSCVFGQNGGWRWPRRRIRPQEQTHHHEFIIHSLPLDGG